MNVEDLTLENIGIWPTWAKVVVVGLVCSFIVGLFFFFDIKPMRSQLLQAELADKELRATYEIKSEQAANLDEYKAQVEEINQRIEGMLAQLPKTLDVPNLIEDISKMGISAGLEYPIHRLYNNSKIISSF